MRIAHVMWQFNVGGTEMLVTDIINEQIARGHQVALYIMSDIADPMMIKGLDSRVKVKTLHRNELTRNPLTRNILPALRLNLNLLLNRAEVVHMHHFSTPYIVRVVPRHHKVLTIHITSKHTMPIDSVGMVIGISDDTCDYIYDKCGVKATTIYNGLHTRAITPQSDLDRYTPGTPFRILQLGRIDMLGKGLDITLKAVAQAIGDGYNVSLDILGEGADISRVKQLAQELGITQHIHFLGKQPREYIYNNLHTYHLLVQPSRQEAFGLTIAEAMAARVPVLVSNIKAPMEVIGHGKYGDYFDGHDYSNMATAIQNIIDNYPLAIDKSDAARKYCIEHYDTRVMVDKYMAAYQKALEDKR